MRNALIVHSSSSISIRENGSSAGSLFWFSRNCEIHTGAAFLNMKVSRKRRVVNVMTHEESPQLCGNQGGTADKVYSSLVV